MGIYSDPLQASIRTLQIMGILDKRFDNIRKDGKNFRSFLGIDSMTNFFEQIQSYIEKISAQEGHYISPSHALDNAALLQQVSGRIGGAKLEAACVRLNHELTDLKKERKDPVASENNYKRCLDSFERVKEEFNRLRNFLEDVAFELDYNGKHNGQEEKKDGGEEILGMENLEKLKSQVLKYVNSGISASMYGVGIGFGFFLMARLFVPCSCNKK